MATFTFNKTQLKQFRAMLSAAPDGSAVWFQPTHHAGCLQIVHPDDKTGDNTFCTRRTGYQRFCLDACLIQTSTQLKEDWIAVLLSAKKALFAVNIVKKTKQIKYSLSTERNKS